MGRGGGGGVAMDLYDVDFVFESFFLTKRVIPRGGLQGDHFRQRLVR